MQATTWFAYRKNWLPFGNQHQVKFVNKGNKEIGAQISYLKKKYLLSFFLEGFTLKLSFSSFKLVKSWILLLRWLEN